MAGINEGLRNPAERMNKTQVSGSSKSPTDNPTLEALAAKEKVLSEAGYRIEYTHNQISKLKIHTGEIVNKAKRSNLLERLEVWIKDAARLQGQLKI